jgi:hypothetical protein
LHTKSLKTGLDEFFLAWTVTLPDRLSSSDCRCPDSDCATPTCIVLRRPDFDRAAPTCTVLCHHPYPSPLALIEAKFLFTSSQALHRIWVAAPPLPLHTAQPLPAAINEPLPTSVRLKHRHHRGLPPTNGAPRSYPKAPSRRAFPPLWAPPQWPPPRTVLWSSRPLPKLRSCTTLLYDPLTAANIYRTAPPSPFPCRPTTAPWSTHPRWASPFLDPPAKRVPYPAGPL